MGGSICKLANTGSGTDESGDNINFLSSEMMLSPNQLSPEPVFAVAGLEIENERLNYIFFFRNTGVVIDAITSPWAE